MANIFTASVLIDPPKEVYQQPPVEQAFVWVCAFTAAQGVSCCGFKEVYGYRIGHKATRGTYDYVDPKDGHYRDLYPYANCNFLGEGSTPKDAIRNCLTKYIKYEKEHYVRNREGMEAMRTFHILYQNEEYGGECYTPELRDELLALNCRKSVLTYRNANTRRKIDAISIIIDRDTALGENNA